MTIQDAITETDNLKPNQYDTGSKLRWLSDIEGKVYDDILSVRMDPPVSDCPKYDFESDFDTALLVPGTYAKIYIYYLTAMIDYHNAELERYNNSMMMFNAAWDEFARYWYSTHRQISKGRFKNV